MIAKKNLKRCMIYPEEKFKKYWDLFITIVLVFSCIEIPYNLAFIPDDNISFIILEAVASFFFALDIVFNFSTAFYDSDYKLIQDRKEIALVYIKGWFILDLMSIIPLPSSS